jgi:hypothetical protein
MTATLEQIHSYATNPGEVFENKVEAAMAVAAVDIIYAGTPAEKLAWAKAAILSIPTERVRFAWYLAAYSGINGPWSSGTIPTDQQIQDAVLWVIDKISV